MQDKICSLADLKLCTETKLATIVDKVSRFCGLYTCCRCNAPLYTLCDTCESSLLYVTPSCLICEKFSQIGEVHAFCRPKSSHYTHSLSCFSYTKTIKCLLHVYKYEAAFQYQRTLEALITQYFRADPFKVLVSWSKFIKNRRLAVVPVPMTWRKESERGFSPAYELAIIFSRCIEQKYGSQVGILKNLLCKTADTSAQATKNKRQRLLSLQGSYMVNDKDVPYFQSYKPEAVIIVDDVVTTGATTNIVIEQLAQNTLTKAVIEKLPIFRLTFAAA